MNLTKNSDIELLLKYYENNQFKNALPLADNIVKSKINNYKIYDICGEIFYKFKLYNKASYVFVKSININPKSFFAYNNLGVSEYFLGNFKKSLKIFENAKKIDDKNSTLYFNIARSYGDLGIYEKSIDNYCTSLLLDKNNKNSIKNLIKALTFFKPKKKYKNKIIEINEQLNSIKIPFSFNKLISDKDVNSFFKESFNLTKNILSIDFDYSQIFRLNNKLLDCSKYHVAFDSFNIIPKFCFSCFKVQIDVYEIFDLIKLHFLFDNLDLFNNIKKCMIEKRKETKGNYKGFIYCSSPDEAEIIKNKVSELINQNLSIKFNAYIKRGCSEFGIKFPNYKITNPQDKNFFQYKEEWEKKENITNDFYPKNNSKELVIKETIPGNSLNDILIILNWINYAKENNDFSYKRLY